MVGTVQQERASLFGVSTQMFRSSSLEFQPDTGCQQRHVLILLGLPTGPT